MSLQSSQSGTPDKASVVTSNTHVLASILTDIGAFDFFPKFIDDEQDDDCLPSYKNPDRISLKYGLSPDLASAFVERSRIMSSKNGNPTSPVVASPSDDFSIMREELKLEIVCQLGKGGFGKVYKCKDTTSKCFVAVKLVNDPKNAQNIVREGQKLRHVNHKNIVHVHSVHDKTISNGTCALVMDWVEGGDLFQHLEAARRRPEQRLPGDAVLRLSRQMLETLVYLHDEMKWLHGDIKPQNMLMQCNPVPADGSVVDYSSVEIKFADFDLALVIEQRDASKSFMLSNSSFDTFKDKSNVAGTELYLSPEALSAVRSGNISGEYKRSYSDDIWSACLVIFEMDTGLSLQQLMMAPGAVKLEMLLTKASPVLMPLLCSVLAAPDAASRCQSAAELLQKLDASIDPLYIWERYEIADDKFVAVDPASSVALEEAFAVEQPFTQLPLQPPLDLSFDIKALLSSSKALGYQTGRNKSGVKCAIRRVLKSSAVTEIPTWQELVNGKEWLQCSPALCGKLEIAYASKNPSAAPVASKYRRVVLKPGEIGSVLLPFDMEANREPYCEPAPAAERAILNMRVHESLPEWDITKLDQVVNPALASKYANYRHRLASLCNGNPNERILFHFASDIVIPKIWKEGEGHDPRLSIWAEVGKGAYFAEHVMYPYAYNYNLWPSPPDYVVKPEPPIGASMKVFCTLVCLGNTADMGPGCETCPSPEWDAWKKEPPVLPKPTRPPAMTLPGDAAEKRNILDIKHVTDAPRYDSVMSTEGDFGTHPHSININESGQRICDFMHPRLRARANEFAKQYVLFDTAASYPMFIATLTKTRDSPMGAQQVIDAGFDADCMKPFQPPPKTIPPPVPKRPTFLSLSSSLKPSSPAATFGESITPVDPNAVVAAKTWCETKGNYASLGVELRKYRRPVSKEDDVRFVDKATVSACVLCHKSFGIIVKKHNCYVCGKIVCDDCSKHRLKRCTECGDWQGVCTCEDSKYDSLRMCKRCHSFGGMSSAANAMKEGLELSRVAVDTAHRALSSFGIGSDPASLARAGCSLSDLQRAGFKTSIRHLKAAGLLAKDLKGLGFRAIDLIEEDCFDVGSLKDAGFSCSELVSTSLDPQALKNAGFLMSDFVAAGCDCAYLQSCGFKDVTSFKAANFSASSLKSVGFSAHDLSAAFDFASLEAAGFSAVELKLANFDALSFKNAGYDAVAMKNAGFGISSLKEIGVSLSDLKIAGFGADAFKTSGCDAVALRTIGFTCEELKAVECSASELTVAGFDINALKNAGYDAAALKTCGHELKVLAAVGCNASELKACGYDASDLKGVGFDAASLKAASFGAAALKNAGFNAHTLKAAGYSLDSLQVAGFQILEMKDAGFTASEFKATATQANVLKDAGFSLASLIDADYDLRSLRLAGFTVQDLIDNGKKNFHELLDAGFANSVLVDAGLVDEVFLNQKYARSYHFIF